MLLSDNYYTAIPMIWVKQALLWKDAPRFIPHGGLAPLTIYLIGGILSLWNNVFIAPRLIGLLFGSFLIFPYYLTVKILFDKKIALFSSFLLCIYPLHITFSILSTSEAPFLFFLFTSLYFFFKFRRQKDSNISFLLYSAIFLNLACMARFEGWLFIPLLTLFLLRGERKSVFTFLFISMIFPLVWMYKSYCIYHNPLFFLTWQNRNVKAEVELLMTQTNYPQTLFAQLSTWIGYLCGALTFPLALLGLLGLIHSFIKKRFLSFVLMAFVLFVAIEYKTFIHTLSIKQPRYILPLSLLLIPYAMVAFTVIVRPIRRGWRQGLIVLFVSYISYFSITKAVKERPLVPPFIKDLTLWLKSHVQPEEKILLDLDKWALYDSDIIVRSRLKRQQFIKFPFYLRYDINIAPAREGIIRDIKNEDIKYLILSRDGIAKKIFHFSGDELEREYGYKFRRVFQSGDYLIYEIGEG